MPIELIDKDGASVRLPRAGGAVPPSGTPPRNQPSLNLSINGSGYAAFACDVSEKSMAVSVHYYRALAVLRLFLPESLGALLALFVIALSIEIALRGELGSAPSAPSSALRQFVIENSGNSKLATSTYDCLATILAVGMFAAIYGFITVVWMKNVVLDPHNTVMREQPMNVFIFILLLIPMTYFVGPYAIQRKILLVPQWLWIGVAILGPVLLLAQNVLGIFLSLRPSCHIGLGGRTAPSSSRFARRKSEGGTGNPVDDRTFPNHGDPGWLVLARCDRGLLSRGATSALDVSFQEVVHSVPAGKAEVVKASVIPGGPNEHPQECPFDATPSRGDGARRC